MRNWKRKVGNFMHYLLAAVVSLWAVPVLAMQELATLGDTEGLVTIERGGKNFRPSIGFPLYQGDGVKTGSTGKARVLLKDNSVLSIGPKSEVKISELKLDTKDRSFLVDVLAGRFKIDVAKWFYGATNGKIQTPSAVAGVRGTVVWGDVDLDAVCALEGSISLESRNGGKSKEMTAGDKGPACGAGMKEGKIDSIQPLPEDLVKFLDQVTIK